MLGLDLQSRANKLEREAKERAEKAKRQAEKERLLAERQRQRLLAHEEALRQARLAEEAAAEAACLAHEEAVEANNGVWWQATLAAVPLQEGLATQKGIKRHADKVLLPAGASSQLMDQEASRNGAMLFELTTPSGGRVHVGVLEFSAPSGTIALPPAVITSLWGILGNGHCHGNVTVTYRKLPQGTYVRFQPRSADFQKDVGDDVEQALQAALLQRSTLTEGEWVVVQHGGVQYDLRVLSLQPASAVSLIDTDMEAEVDPSIETEEALRAEQERAQARMAELARLEEESIRKAMEEAQQRQQELADRDRLQKDAAARLPPEPQAGAPGTAAARLRLPDGAVAGRRFSLESPVQSLFDFADAQGGGGLAPGSYQLVMQFPRRVISLADGADRTLAQAGMAAGQEVLMLQPLPE